MWEERGCLRKVHGQVDALSASARVRCLPQFVFMDSEMYAEVQAQAA
jgi:hypothetical protein